MKAPFLKKICLIISFILVSSCTGGVNNKNSSSTFDDITNIEDIEKIDLEELKNKKISITLWNAFSNNQFNIVNKYINEFKNIYPNVTITQLSKGNMEDLDYSLYAAVTAKKTPTIAILNHSYIPEYIRYGAVEELNSFIEAKNINHFEDKNDYIKEIFENGTSFSLDGKMYSLPLFNYSNVLFFNKIYLENSTIDINNLSWLENNSNSIINLARIIKEKNNAIIPLYVESPEILYKVLSMQFNIPYTKLNGTAEGKFLYTSLEAIELIKKIKDWIDEGLLVIGDDLKLSSNENPLTKVAMAIAPSNYYPKYELANGNTSVALIPQEDRNNLFNEIISDDFIIFEKEPIENKIMAYLFYKYITNRENCIDYSLYCDSMPIKYSAYSSDEFQKNLSIKDLEKKLISLYQDIYSSLLPMPTFVGSRTSDKEIRDLLITISNNDFSSLSSKEIDEFIKKSLMKAYNASIMAQGNN